MCSLARARNNCAPLREPVFQVKRLTIVEIGCGLRVPSVRLETEAVLADVLAKVARKAFQAVADARAQARCRADARGATSETEGTTEGAAEGAARSSSGGGSGSSGGDEGAWGDATELARLWASRCAYCAPGLA